MKKFAQLFPRTTFVARDTWFVLGTLKIDKHKINKD